MGAGDVAPLITPKRSAILYIGDIRRCGVEGRREALVLLLMLLLMGVQGAHLVGLRGAGLSRHITSVRYRVRNESELTGLCVFEKREGIVDGF